MEDTDLDTRIFDGIRIIEFGWAVVGPLTTSWAGGYGAEVIKVETKTRPDIIRSMTPFKDDRVNLDNSLFFGRENANKLSISLNLKHPRAVQLAKDLVSLSRTSSCSVPVCTVKLENCGPCPDTACH